MSWELGFDGLRPYIEMTVRENASAVYDWNNGEETAVDPAPNSSLGNPFTVSVVGGFSLDSVPIYTQGEDRVFNVLASWDLHDDEYVLSGGKYEVVYKESTEMTYKSAGQVDGSENQIRLPALKPDITYDIGIYAYNSLGPGVRSALTLIEDFLVGTTVSTDTEDWENETFDRDGDDWENDTLTSEDWES